MSKFRTSSTSTSNFICASSMPKKKYIYIYIYILVVLGSVKFQLPIISLVNFCNYSLFFLNLEYILDIKGIWQIQNKINIYVLYELNGLC